MIFLKHYQLLALVKTNRFINCCTTHCMSDNKLIDRTKLPRPANTLKEFESISDETEEKKKEEELVKETEPETQVL